jgi:hypothetical protein
MEKEKVVIDGVIYVKESEQLADELNGMRYCIIRCYRAGVHAGYVKERNGPEVTLLKTRRLWRWYGKTLSGLAKDGSFAPEKCKYSDKIEEITVLDACEIIPCTEAGKKSIEGVAPWKNE